MKMNKRQKNIFYLVVIILIILGIYLLKNYLTQSNGDQQKPIPSVVLLKIKRQNFPLEYEYTGRVKGIQEVDIVPRTNGIILERLYSEGSIVKKGAVLFKLDSDTYQAALSKAKANFSQEQQELNRAKILYDKKFMSAEAYQAAQAKFVEENSNLKTAQINLNYTEIIAPIDGYITKENLSAGNLVEQNKTILTHIVQLDPIYVEFMIPEEEDRYLREQVKSGKYVLSENNTLQAKITLSDGSLYPQIGSVKFIDNLVDPKTGTVNSRVVIHNSQNTLLPGQFVNITLQGINYKNAILIPDQAIQQNASSTFAYVVDSKGKAQIRKIKLGILKDSNRVIEEGLDQDDLVIVEGMIKVEPGQAVQFNLNEHSKHNNKIRTQKLERSTQ